LTLLRGISIAQNKQKAAYICLESIGLYHQTSNSTRPVSPRKKYITTSGAGFSLRGLDFARPKPHRLKLAPLNPKSRLFPHFKSPWLGKNSG
jgi:hypothetical protein